MITATAEYIEQFRTVCKCEPFASANLNIEEPLTITNREKCEPLTSESRKKVRDK